MINKGFEVIEAHWLFDIPADKIEVLVHPQSIVHSLVQFCDGSIKAQLGKPDMRLPIAYAFSYPQRSCLDFPRTELTNIGNLNFYKPDYIKFPCLALAFEALAKGGSMPAVLNAANEIAVQAFLLHEIRFNNIPVCIEKALERFDGTSYLPIDNLIALNDEVRCFTEDLIDGIK